MKSPQKRSPVAVAALSLLLGSSVFSAGASAAPTPRQVQIDNADSVAALKAAVGDPVTGAFYDRVGWRIMWNDESAAALTQALKARTDHGLDHVSFGDAGTDSGQSAAERDVSRTRAALGYALALAHGEVDPASVHEVYTLDRPKGDIGAGLQQALAAGRVGPWFATLAPQDADYKRLSAAYLTYRQQAQDAPPQVIADKGTIHVGDTDPRVPGIVKQLIDSDYLPGVPAGTNQGRYTQAAADAMKGLQRDYGIAADGVVGSDTLGVLNLNPADRERSLAVALERRRWLDRNPAATRIDVNVAAARLSYYRDGRIVDQRKAIVGKPGKETPLLAAPIYRLVANPTWTVPKSIQNTELAHVGGSYLRAHNMVMRGGWIVQQPGPNNSLGQVKFDMKDDYAIYLHDTSAPSLFARSDRHLSHGCVRVEDALGFAEQLADEEGVGDQWRKARASGKQSFIALPREIPVRLLYQNVFVTENDQVAFRTDPYGWNDAVATKLGFTGGQSRATKAEAIDIGP